MYLNQASTIGHHTAQSDIRLRKGIEAKYSAVSTEDHAEKEILTSKSNTITIKEQTRSTLSLLDLKLRLTSRGSKSELAKAMRNSEFEKKLIINMDFFQQQSMDAMVRLGDRISADQQTVSRRIGQCLVVSPTIATGLTEFILSKSHHDESRAPSDMLHDTESKLMLIALLSSALHTTISFIKPYIDERISRSPEVKYAPFLSIILENFIYSGHTFKANFKDLNRQREGKATMEAADGFFRANKRMLKDQILYDKAQDYAKKLDQLASPGHIDDCLMLNAADPIKTLHSLILSYEKDIGEDLYPTQHIFEDLQHHGADVTRSFFDLLLLAVQVKNQGPIPKDWKEHIVDAAIQLKEIENHRFNKILKLDLITNQDGQETNLRLSSMGALKTWAEKVTDSFSSHSDFDFLEV